jgi:hypothetical protein
MTASIWNVQPTAALALLLGALALGLSIKNSPAPPTASGVQLTSNLGSAYVPDVGESALVCYDIDRREAGFVRLEFGGVRLLGKGLSSVTFDIFEPGCASVSATSAKELKVFKSGDFDGHLRVTVQRIKTKSDAGTIVALRNARLEARTAGLSGLQSYYIGENSGENDAGGIANYGFGYQALQSVISGEQNIAIGWRALNKLTGAKANVAVGTRALEQNLTGYNNTAVGTAAMESNVTGYDNAAFGIRALALTQSGDNNTGIGTDSFEENVSGSLNTGLGTYSGRQNKTSSRNTAAGYGAMYHYTGDEGQNTSVGTNSLGALLGGGLNTAVGVNSGLRVENAVDSTWIGTGAGESDLQKKDVQNSTAIGAASFTDRDNQVSIGTRRTTQTRTWGSLTLKSTYATTGEGVHTSSIFIGQDGNLYFKSITGNIAKLTDISVIPWAKATR